jgi:hypothetical protein
VGLEGDVAAQFDATSCLGSSVGCSEDCALGAEVAVDNSLRMIECVKKDGLNVDVDRLEDG